MCLVWSWRRRHLDNCDCDKVNTLGRPHCSRSFDDLFSAVPRVLAPLDQNTATLPQDLLRLVLHLVNPPSYPRPPWQQCWCRPWSWCHGALVPVCSGHQTCVRQGVSPPRPAQPYPPSALLVTRQLSSPLSTAGQGKTEIKDHSIVSRLLNNVCSFLILHVKLIYELLKRWKKTRLKSTTLIVSWVDKVEYFS